jgi:hypothetical protein
MDMEKAEKIHSLFAEALELEKQIFNIKEKRSVFALLNIEIENNIYHIDEKDTMYYRIFDLLVEKKKNDLNILIEEIKQI